MDKSCFEIGVSIDSNIRSRKDDTSEGSSYGCRLKRSWNIESGSRTNKVIHGENSSIYSEISSLWKNDRIGMRVKVERDLGTWVSKSSRSIENKVSIYSRRIKDMGTCGFHVGIRDSLSDRTFVVLVERSGRINAEGSSIVEIFK